MILLKIDVTKLDKDRFVKGKKGTYCDLVLIDKPNEYGDDGMIVQSITKEERDAGGRGATVGNWRSVSKSHGPPVSPREPKPLVQKEEDDDIPF